MVTPSMLAMNPWSESGAFMIFVFAFNMGHSSKPDYLVGKEILNLSFPGLTCVLPGHSIKASATGGMSFTWLWTHHGEKTKPDLRMRGPLRDIKAVYFEQAPLNWLG
jgi:hypothetical protein